MATSSSVSSSRSANPFRITQPTQLFGYKESQNLKERTAKSQLMKLTLVQRSKLLHPPVPIYRSQDVTSKSSAFSSSYNFNHSSLNHSYSGRKEERQQRCRRMTEFIQQKREIYQVQLLIDRKREEIQKIKNEIRQKENEYNDDEASMFDTAQKYKILTAKVEDELAKGRKQMEQAISERVTLQKQMKRQNINIEIIKSELSKNEDLLEHYQEYSEFLSKFDDKTLMNNPDNLLREFSDLEKENLFLIQECEEFQTDIIHSVEEPEKRLKHAKDALQRITDLLENSNEEKQLKDLQETHEIYSKPVTTDSVDNEIKEISELVEKTFFNCFGRKADLSAIAKLEKIENKLEDFYKQIENVAPSFVHMKQSKFDKDRREEMRVALQKEKEQIQQEKKEQALARANKPIKKKMGRPVMERSLPRHFVKKDNEKLLRLLAEQKAQEEFLFGEIK